MKKILLILLLLPCFASAQIETYLVSPYGNIEFDSARVMTIDSGIVYVTPTMLSDSLAGVGGGTDSSIFATQYRLDSTRNGLDTRINLRVKYTDTATMLTPYLRKLDTVSLSNRITSIDTNALKTNTPMSSTLDTVQRNGVNSALSIATDRISVNGSIVTTNNGAVFTNGTGPIYTNGSGSIFANGTGELYTTNADLHSGGTGNIYTGGTGNIYTSNGNIVVNNVSKSFIGTYLTPSEILITNGSKSIVSAPVATYPSLTELTYLKGVTSDIQTQINLKAPLANPTFTGTVTIPTPFTLGATSVTTTGTRLNYLASAGGTTGTTSTNLVFSTSPTLVTPVLGVASATSMNVGGGTLNGVVNALSTTDITLASTAHALTIGGASSSTNLVGGEYSTGVGLQARNNGAIGVLFLNPLGGDTRIGAAAPAGASNFTLFHVGTGTGDYAEISGRNGAGAAADGLLHRTFGTSWTTSGSNFQDGGASMTGTNLSGGYSIGTQASADLRFYSNNTLRTTIQAGGNTIHTARVQLSKGANVASAGDLTLGSAGNSFSITGTTTINAITTTNWQSGSIIILIFASTPTVKNNTAGGASTAKMLLNGGVDFSATANDVLTLIYDGTNWLECSRSIN